MALPNNFTKYLYLFLYRYDNFYYKEKSFYQIISEEDLKAQIEELLEKYKTIQKSTITICEEWLDKLNSGVKVKDL